MVGFLILSDAQAEGNINNASLRYQGCKIQWEWNKEALLSKVMARARFQSKRYRQDAYYMKREIKELLGNEKILGILSIHDPILLASGLVAEVNIMVATFSARMASAAAALDPTDVSKRAMKAAKWTPRVVALAKDIGRSIAEGRINSMHTLELAASEIADKNAEIEIRKRGGGNRGVALYRAIQAFRMAAKDLDGIVKADADRTASFRTFKQTHAHLQQLVILAEENLSETQAAVTQFQNQVEQSVLELCEHEDDEDLYKYADPDRLREKFISRNKDQTATKNESEHFNMDRNINGRLSHLCDGSIERSLQQSLIQIRQSYRGLKVKDQKAIEACIGQLEQLMRSAMRNCNADGTMSVNVTPHLPSLQRCFDMADGFHQRASQGLN